MRYTRALPAALLFLSTIVLATAATTRADDYADEAQATTRVARISLLRGDVSLERAGSNDWEQATLNLPLVEGDTLATAQDARLEIQIDARNFVRISENSVLQIVTLRNEGIALSLTEGTATLRLARFDRDKESFEIDAPKTTMAVEKEGLYRLDVGHDGSVRITVRDDGRARIYSETSGFTLREGRSALLSYDASEAGDWELSAAPPLDDWDQWTMLRERDLLAQMRSDQRYYNQNMWGAEQLSSYGDWFYANDYHCWAWRPHRRHTSDNQDWTPYRDGHWRWCHPYGWTWVGAEPWGWAPYHYGRWVYHDGSWCWVPRGNGDGPNRWHPALVTFVVLRNSRNRDVAWYPIRYGERDPRYWDGRPVPPGASDVNDDTPRASRLDSDYLRAVTTLPADEFNKYGVRGRPAPPELARVIVQTPPVRGSLPIVTADKGVKGRGDANGGGQIIVPPPAGTRPVRPLPPERHTGAATRKPGVALDDELLRTRVYHGREPQPAPGAGTNNGDAPTGAVTRPLPPATRGGSRINTGRVDNDGTPPGRSPARPRAADAEEEPPSSPNVNERPERERRPAPPRVNDDRSEKPQPVEPKRSEPVERKSSPPARSDPPKERSAPPAERERPAAREERAPAREERTTTPEPRSQPAPQREQPSEPRRESPPPKSEPSREREAPPSRKGL